MLRLPSAPQPRHGWASSLQTPRDEGPCSTYGTLVRESYCRHAKRSAFDWLIGCCRSRSERSSLLQLHQRDNLGLFSTILAARPTAALSSKAQNLGLRGSYLSCFIMASLICFIPQERTLGSLAYMIVHKCRHHRHR